MRYLILAAVVVAAVVLFVVLRPNDDTAAESSQPPAATMTTTAEPKSSPKPKPKPKPDRRERRARVAKQATLEVLVRDGRPVGGIRRLEVKKGREVRLIVRADVRDEVHVHGYDLSRDVRPGAQARLTFVADATGRFEIELESRHVQVAELEVQP